jgi:septal ring factor EnvC (AmiA/AmiB activator)
MPDDATRFRLERLEETQRDLAQRVVPTDLYVRDRAELERDIADLRAALAEERTARRAAVEAERIAREKADEDEEDDRKRDVQDIKTQMAARGVSWRQALYAGLFPVLLFLATIVFQLKAGTGK